MQSQNYIGGQWHDAEQNRQLDVVNPATEELIHRVAASDAKDIGRAVDAAKAAFEGGWRRTSGRERAGYLRAIAQGIEERLDALARLEVRDNGKPLPEAKWDIEDTAGCFAYYADLAEELDGRQGEPIALPSDDFEARVFYEPAGVCGQIIPWNYPMLMAAWKVAPALAAGCASVLKPSELTPLTALELAAIADAAGLPAGVLNVVTGTGPEAGAPLSAHPDVAKLAFTGSVPTGARVMAAAAQDIKNISLELGGKSPILVFDDADIEAAVEWVMFGIFWNQGEVCSATSRLLVQEGIAPRLLARLAEEAAKISTGDGMEDGVLLGPLVSEAQHEKVMGMIEAGIASGATLLTGGGRPQHLNRGYFIAPTIFVDPPEDAPIWREEIFGPVLCARTFRDEREAVARANDSSFGLAAAIMSSDEARIERIVRELEAGIVWVNCSQPTFTEAPWGGMKKSGIGRELGRWGLENYLEAKQVTTYVSAEPWAWYLKN